jgi:hypothetical protein
MSQKIQKCAKKETPIRNHTNHVRSLIETHTDSQHRGTTRIQTKATQTHCFTAIYLDPESVQLTQTLKEKHPCSLRLHCQTAPGNRHEKQRPMEEIGMTDTQDRLISDCPDVFGRMAIYCSTLAASTLLWIAYHGITNDWLIFESARLQCLWYSEAIVVPLVISFVIRGTRVMFPWMAGFVTAAVIAMLAAYTGGAYLADLKLNAGTIFAPYALSLIVALFVLMPFVQLWRDGRARFSYARLYQLSWDNTLTLLTAIVFTFTGWLILWLCGALLAVIGMDFFEKLFEEMIFVYPVTSLFA